MIVSVIPCCNEISTVSQVAQRAARFVDSVIVVCDGSADTLISRINRTDRVRVIRNQRNMGKGYALTRGFHLALDLGADSIVTLDADAEHDPNRIPSFLKKLDEGADVVSGCRTVEAGTMAYAKRKLVSAAVSALAGRRVSDPLCGFRAYRSSIISRMPSMDDRGFGVDLSILIWALNHAAHWTEVPVDSSVEKNVLKRIELVNFLDSLTDSTERWSSDGLEVDQMRSAVSWVNRRVRSGVDFALRFSCRERHLQKHLLFSSCLAGYRPTLAIGSSLQPPGIDPSAVIEAYTLPNDLVG
jgi:glycosyltransferase involved in cell wall biosynthesis